MAPSSQLSALLQNESFIIRIFVILRHFAFASPTIPYHYFRKLPRILLANFSLILLPKLLEFSSGNPKMTRFFRRSFMTDLCMLFQILLRRLPQELLRELFQQILLQLIQKFFKKPSRQLPPNIIPNSFRLTNLPMLR